jgi:leucyl-tRNA synthetase
MDFKRIEEKWQKRWEEEKPFKAIDFHPTKPKYYVLYEFPNISGNIHLGHLKGTIPADVLARMKRFQGYNVLFPIGGDAFGMPAENAAIKKGINPRDFVANGMKTIMGQFKKLGLSFDFDRTVATSDPEYYKWTQWIFLQLFKHGKAYKQKGFVNFCPNCQTVLSNEDSQGGKCDRCGGAVVQEERWVWFLKMKEYSEKLLENIDRIEMAEHLKEAQRNWIGRSEGMQVAFDLFEDNGNKLGQIEIFTTCIETIYGITFLVLAPEIDLVDKYKDKIKNLDEVMAYRKQTALRSEFDRMSDLKEKTGCKLDGLYVVNPVNNTKVPLYLADFVLAGYGTGCVMAVPSHDQRDYDFAKAFNIPIIQVIEGDISKQAVEKKEYLAKNSKLLNSEEFSGMPVLEAKKKISEKVIAMGVGKKQVNYKMQDWSFNRQRYWGEPFPVVFCEHCGAVALDEKDLPLVLPETDDYRPNVNGDSALSKLTDWVNCKCPKCGGKARRETDIMPNWAGSSWYWLRYMDPRNEKALVDFEKAKYWGSVDCYTGGTEHITRHVLYAFFWQNFLYEIGAVPTRDPFVRKMGSGLILDDQGKKMSKSSTNGVSPLEVIEKYGVDVARMHVHFLGGYEDNTPWTYEGITGITAFLDKVWALKDILKGDEVSKEHIFELNRLIKKITEDYQDFKLNTAISAFMIFVKKVREDGFITKEELRQFLVLLNPLAPHITSEIFEIVFGKNILDEKWPEFDEKYLVEDTISLPVQINGRFARTITVSRTLSQDEIVNEIVTNHSDLCADAGTLKKVIYVPGKIVNLIK